MKRSSLLQTILVRST